MDEITRYFNLVFHSQKIPAPCVCACSNLVFCCNFLLYKGPRVYRISDWSKTDSFFSLQQFNRFTKSVKTVETNKTFNTYNGQFSICFTGCRLVPISRILSLSADFQIRLSGFFPKPIPVTIVYLSGVSQIYKQFLYSLKVKRQRKNEQPKYFWINV